MFIGAEIRLEAGISAVQARLTNLIRGGLLQRASEDAYGEWVTGLTRVGPLGHAPGLAKLVRVQFRDTVVREDSATWVLRWEAAGRSGALFPALDADIKLTADGQDATVLTVSGVYRPPLGGLGAGLDRVVLHRIAQATMHAFADSIADAITNPDAAPATGRAVLPDASSWPSPETP